MAILSEARKGQCLTCSNYFFEYELLDGECKLCFETKNRAKPIERRLAEIEEDIRSLRMTMRIHQHISNMPF